MLLLEHHGKELLRAHGFATPDGVFVANGGQFEAERGPVGPWVVKAQLASGGRGKAGGVVMADDLGAVEEAVAALQAFEMNGRPCLGVRIERRFAFHSESYVSFSIDPAGLGVHILMSGEGGVEIESAARVLQANCALDGHAMLQAAQALAAQLSSAQADGVASILPKLVEFFIKSEALLLEVNPLFTLADGSAVAGDVKLAIDENALERLAEVKAIVDENPTLYSEAAFKARHGFDFVELDHDGEIGLLTTGAGLSMMLVDDMRSRGGKPINFCDVRSGLLRGSPQRLIDALTHMTTCPNLKAVFVSIFAGVTDLGEFATLLIAAKRATPGLDAPFVARLVGNNLESAADHRGRGARDRRRGGPRQGVVDPQGGGRCSLSCSRPTFRSLRSRIRATKSGKKLRSRRRSA